MLVLARTAQRLAVDGDRFVKSSRAGEHSVGVARQYSGMLGKVGNSQIGVSLSYATDAGCLPLDFQLYMPESWVQDAARRRRARIPDDVTFKTKWQLGLEMIDRARAWDLPGEVVVADAGYGVATQFRAGLRERQVRYVVGIPGEVGVWRQPVVAEVPAYQGRGRPRTRPRNLPPPEKVLAVAMGLPSEAWCDVMWREGTKGPLQSRFAALRVQPSHGHTQGKVSEPVQWLFVEWPHEEPQPTKFWLSNLPDWH